MDIEQLKLILDTLGNAGDAAMNVAFAWLFLELLKVLIWIVPVVGVCWVINRIIQWCRETEDDKVRLKELRNIVLPGEVGSVCISEFRKIRSALEAGVRAEEQAQKAAEEATYSSKVRL